MQTVIVAIDNDMACSHVLSAAGALSAALEARLIAVHVRDDGDRFRGDIERVVERDAWQAGVRLREFDGDVVDTLCRAASGTAVAAVAIGTRRDMRGPHPTGSIAGQLITHLQIPVLCVPPDAKRSPRLQRALVPIDGDPDTTSSLGRIVPALRQHDVELTALHIFDTEHAPPLEDHAPHELEAWRETLLLDTFADKDVQLHLRSGWAPEHVVDVARETEADLIVLPWKRRIHPPHAAVIRLVLSLSHVPVLLLDAQHLAAEHAILQSRHEFELAVLP